jgi:uncharacterized protein (DUF58 family)
MTEPLLDAEFLQRLAHLRFIIRGRHSGRLTGVHSSRRAGVSLEFADYRPYCLGDDLRYVDWNAYGRLDRVLVKTFVHEVDLPVTVLLDRSASMGLGDPPKLRYGAQLAAALCYLALRGMDRVGVYPFSDRLHPGLPPRHGMRHMGHVVRALQELRAGGPTSIDEALEQYVGHSQESGLVFLVGDMLGGNGYERGISRLRVRGDRVVVVQLLDREELHPAAEGPLRLLDVESSEAIDITVGPEAIAGYRRRLEEEIDRLERFLAGLRIPHFLAPTDVPLETLLHHRFRHAGVLQ